MPTAVQAAVSTPSEAQLAFVLDPLASYPLMLDPLRTARSREIFAALVRGGASARVSAAGPDVRQAAELLRAEEPSLPVAAVLLAQAAFLDSNCTAVLSEVAPLVEALPDYAAARLLRARCRELGDDPIGAFEDYRFLQASAEAAAAGEVIAQALSDLQPRALEIVSNRFFDALRRGRSELAALELERLEAWAPEDDLTLEARWRLAAASGDASAELDAVEHLQRRYPDNLQLLERRAELELLVGDPTTAVRLMTELSDSFPDDPVIADKLDAAKFRWRLAMSPPEIQDLADLPVLSRADFALLLHALMPGVRSGQVVRARIAGDILQHPHREEIARVINLGLMDVDAEVHRFEPDRPVTRLQVLRSLLRGMESQNGAAPACLGDLKLNTTPSISRICEAAVACRLLTSEADCLPRAEATGRETVDLLRLSIRALGVAG